MFKTKDAKLDIKDLDAKQGIVVRYGSSFGVVDSYGDRTIKGCFEETIKNWGPNGRNRIKSLFQHDPSALVAKPLELVEDAKGLLITDQFSKTAFAQDILILLQEEIITESSIGYSDKDFKPNDHGGFDLLEVQLYECSYVTWGSNMDTPIVGMKAQALFDSIQKQDDVFGQMKRLESAMRKGTFETDEVPQILELALAMWESKLNKLEEGKKNNGRIVIPEGSKADGEVSKVEVTFEGPEAKDRKRQLETLLSWMHFNTRWGHSGVVAMGVDGDGQDMITVEGLDLDSYKEAVKAINHREVNTSVEMVKSLPFLIEKSAFDCDSTLFEIRGSVAQHIRELQGEIKKGDIKELERYLHITCRYGLVLDGSEVLEPIVDALEPIQANITGLNAFQSEQHDVLYLAIESEGLLALNEQLQALTGKPSDYDEYTPHITLAYLKPNTAQKYIDEMSFEIKNLILDTFVYSSRYREQTKWRLVASAQAGMSQDATDEDVNKLVANFELHKLEQQAKEFRQSLKGTSND